MIAGRLSYAQKCQQKILELENSPLADRIRQAQRRRLYGDT